MNLLFFFWGLSQFSVPISIVISGDSEGFNAQSCNAIESAVPGIHTKQE